MNKKSGKERNLMSVEHLLSRIAKYANEPEKRLKEAHQMTKATFPMVQGMPSGNNCTPAVAVRVPMDCEGNAIACDHPEYEGAEHWATRRSKPDGHGSGYCHWNLHCGWNSNHCQGR